jgi:serine/threonine protein kinase
MVKTVGKYELYRTLGEGSFGKVKYAVNKETNEAVAIKILDKDKIQKQNMGAQIKKEISIMKMINHQYVVCVKDVFATTSKIFLVLELVEGGELFNKISSQGRLTEEQARFYFRQVAEGLDHCHSQGVCHRDLKPEVRKDMEQNGRSNASSHTIYEQIVL